MGSKAFMLSILAIFLVITSEVAARELAQKSTSSLDNGQTNDAKFGVGVGFQGYLGGAEFPGQQLGGFPRPDIGGLPGRGVGGLPWGGFGGGGGGRGYYGGYPRGGRFYPGGGYGGGYPGVGWYGGLPRN